MADEHIVHDKTRDAETIQLPAPTAWPIVVAFGVTLACGGMVTSATVGVAGVFSAAAGLVGWFRETFPLDAHVTVLVAGAPPPVRSKRREVARVHVAPGLTRARVPLEIYPVSAGVKGGLAGSIAMAAMAMLYGVVSGTSVWYPINLLAAGFLPGASLATTTEIGAFHLRLLLIAIPIHLTTSLLVGLMYGAMLPVLARRPILLGGLVAPVFWSGLVHSVLNIVNPVLNQRIDWFWFVLSQIAFGLVSGIVVSRQERVRTWQAVPLAVRIGVEAPGIFAGKDGGDGR